MAHPALVVALMLTAGQESAHDLRRAALEDLILDELARVAPAAVEEARAAAAAYQADRWQEAFDRYGQVLAAAPEFPHALRRRCNARMRLGDRAGALPICRAAAAATEVERALNAQPSPYDSHPRPADRIAWVGDVTSAYEPDGAEQAPAWELFADREALERRLTDEVRANVAARHGVQIPAEPPAGTADGAA